jgi:predicted transcriptional regulator
MVKRFVYPAITRQLAQPRMLPQRGDRVLVGVQINSNLDMKLEILALLQGLPKSELALRAVTGFVEHGKSCEAALSIKSDAHHKRRVTLTFSQEIDERLEAFARRLCCHKATVITAALVEFLNANKIDAYSDPTIPVLAALQSSPQVTASESW